MDTLHWTYSGQCLINSCKLGNSNVWNYFADAVYNQANIGIPKMPKKPEWMSMVVMPLSEEGSIQEVKGIESFTPTYRLETFLKEFITGRNPGEEMDDLANGVTYTDRKKKQTFIRTEDFVNFCNKRKIKINISNLNYQNLFSELGIFIIEK